MPDVLVKDPDWVILLFSIFDPSQKMMQEVLNDDTVKDLGGKANALFLLLAGRLNIHVKDIIKKKSQQSH